MGYRYKNVSGMDQTIVGVGVVKADAEFTINGVIHNPNFQLVTEAVATQDQQQVAEKETE